MISIARIVQTCEACPSQWEGFFDDGRAFYIRFRWGHLRMTVHASDPMSTEAESVLHWDDDSEGWNGKMTYDELRLRLLDAGVLTPPEMESPDTYHRGIVPALSY